MPTLYNKTTTDKKYGNVRFPLVLPASSGAGTRGAAVPITLATRLSMNISQQAIELDLDAGNIEIDPT